MEFQSTAGLDLTNGDLTNQLITLPPLVGLTVVVTDSNGNPVQGAGISFDGLSGCTGLPSLQGVPGTSAGGYEVFSGGPATDATGSSTMLVVPCQTPQDGETSGSITVYVTAPAGSNYVNTQTTYSGSFESATTVSVTIPTGVVYSGRVVDSQGNPVSGAEIALTKPPSQAILYSSTTTSDGSFSIPALPGTYGVDVDPSSYDGSGTSDMEFQSTAGLDLTNGDLTNQLITLPPLVGLTVVVTDSNGNPVQGAGISFDGLSGCTGLPSLQGVPGTSAGGTRSSREDRPPMPPAARPCSSCPVKPRKMERQAGQSPFTSLHRPVRTM